MLALSHHVSTGKAARNAAMEFLRSFGRAGTSAFRFANMTAYPQPTMSASRFGLAPGVPSAVAPGAGFHMHHNAGYMPTSMYGQPGGPGVPLIVLNKTGVKRGSGETFRRCNH